MNAGTDYKAEIRERMSAVLREQGILGERDQATALAEVCQVQRSTACRWLRGETFPLESPDHVSRFCDRFGLAPNWLLIGHGPTTIQEREVLDRLRDLSPEALQRVSKFTHYIAVDDKGLRARMEQLNDGKFSWDEIDAYMDTFPEPASGS